MKVSLKTKNRCLIQAILLTLGAALLSSCKTIESRQMRATHLPMFFIEAVGAELRSSKMVSIQLPVSASVIQIKPVPTIPAFDIAHVTMAEGEKGIFLQFELKKKARLQLMRICAEYRGRRLVLMLGGRPVGAWRIDCVLDQGMLSTYVEIPDEAIPQLVDAINLALK